MSYSIVVQLAISPAALPAATVGNAYTAALSAVGGTSPYTWSLASGTLPAGLSLSASTGVISGTPSAAGTSDFTIQVTDSSSPELSGSKTYSLVVKLALSPGPLPTGTANTAYSTTLSATGGTAPYSWALVSGTLPTGLSLSASTGVISGTPTNAGTSTSTVQASDASSPTLSANKTYSIVVKLAISPTSLPAAKVNNAYSATLSASGGTSPYTWKLASGALPKGLSLSASTGMISGTPTKAGASTFTIRVTDASSPALSTIGSYSLTVSP